MLWLYKAIADLEAARADQGRMDGNQLEIAADDAALVASRMEELGRLPEAGMLKALSNRLYISGAAALAAEQQRVEEAERVAQAHRERQIAYGLCPDDPVDEEEDEEDETIPKRSQLCVLLKEPHKLAPSVQARLEIAEAAIEEVCVCGALLLVDWMDIEWPGTNNRYPLTE